MSSNVTALLVAVAGVLGTLTSPILTQRFTLRTKQQEIDALKQQRSEERAEEQRRAAFKEGRDSCIALNTTARGFRQALKNCLFEGYDLERTELEQARRLFTGRYGEAQIILSDTVMDAAIPVWDTLAVAYGRVRAIGTELALPENQAERDKVMSYLDEEVENAIQELRRTMRSDLGITSRTSDHPAI